MMLWIYISKNLDALEVKVEEFLEKFSQQKLLHLRRASFEEVKSSLTQLNLFENYTHYIFEDYKGKLSDLQLLFNNISFENTKILFTIFVENKIALSWEILNKLEDKNYWLYSPGVLIRNKYLNTLLQKNDLQLSSEYIEFLKEGALFSCLQLKGVIEQLKIFSFSGEKITKEIVLGSIKSNKICEASENPFTFLDLYLTNQIQKWVLLLRKMSYSLDSLISFLRCFSYSLNQQFWNTSNSLETSNFIRELSYNFLLFMELKFFKIKRDSSWLVFHFFWKHQPVCKLALDAQN
ncbi:hypothetical protein [Mycoplasma parvum]|nr:hypothetical protein [Mycoplasma parvum]